MKYSFCFFSSTVSLIENKSYDIIIVRVTVTPSRCDVNHPWMGYGIPYLYILNNPNIYFTFHFNIPFSNTELSEYIDLHPHCYLDLIYLLIGNPLPVNNFEELIIRRTGHTYVFRHVYKRNYSRGLVLLNDHPEDSFSYRLRTSS